MNHIVVESNNNFIKMNFGMYSSFPFNLSQNYLLSKSAIEEVVISGDGVVVFTSGRNSHTLYLSHEQLPPLNAKTHYLIIDLINNIKPTSKEHLIELIYAV